ncbi:MAG: helix-turn-helix transcriptional regulator [Eggerthellaceae bacterium]|nr:helix-turn-helix transcriptional regulator [Eggerthellaceae bacterium]
MNELRENHAVIKQALGANIRARREALGLGALQFSQMVSVNRYSLRQIEAGTANPTIETLLAIADGLSLSLPDLLEGNF